MFLCCQVQCCIKVWWFSYQRKLSCKFMYKSVMILYCHVQCCLNMVKVTKEICYVQLCMKLWWFYVPYRKKLVMFNYVWSVMILQTKRKLSCTIMNKSVVMLCNKKKLVMYNYVWKCHDFMYQKKVVPGGGHSNVKGVSGSSKNLRN